MILRRLYALLFLIILSVQLLPIAELTEVFTKRILTEEVQENSVCTNKLTGFDEDKLPSKDLNIYHIPGSLEYVVIPQITSTYFLENEALIKCFHLEVLLQPPNFC